MGLNLAQLLTAKAYVWTGPGIEARGLRLAPSTYEALRRNVESQTWPGTSESMFPNTTLAPVLTGLAVRVDRYLPAGVWRLTAEDGSLLYDSRQGRKGREWT